MQTTAQNLLRVGLDHFGTPTAFPVLSVYLEELLAWNTAFGLTAAKSVEELVSAHVLDSLAALPVLCRVLVPDALIGDTGRRGATPESNHLGRAQAPWVCDIGSGAGFPGLPLAAALPSARFVLVERMEKRADFLRRCITAMGLANVTVEQCRAEDAAKGRFDVAVFRALHPLSDRKTLGTLLSLIKSGGVLAAYKGRAATINEELAVVKTLRPDLKVEICPLANPYLPDHERHLVLIHNY
jgi:16S rRNA (guanine527-N7)-methyltransferase